MRHRREALVSGWSVLDGRRVHYRTVGPRSPDADVVILVHGLGVSGRYLLPTAERLAPHFRVYVPDLPGFGDSDPPSRPITIPELADVLVRWMDVEGITAASMLANSMGCQIVVECAACRPGRVDRLVLVGPTVDRSARTLFFQAARLAMSALHEPPSAWLLVAADYLKVGPRRIYRTFRHALAHRIEERLRAVRVPTLLVRGEHDWIAPRAWVEELRACAPESHVVEIPGAGHIPNYSAPDELVEVCLPFLSHEARRVIAGTGAVP